MRTWLITGTSSGLGRALAERALAAGDRVAGTFRNEAARADFERLAPGRSLGCLLDVTDEAAVRREVDDVLRQTGAIDVLVNNAGYGFEGAVEEATLAEVRAQFETNVFGAVSMMQAVLPGMRQRRAGHIVNISSIGGLAGFPAVGIYNGSKFALEGISEALAKEVAPLGIKVTIVEPGGFRTDWAGRSMIHARRKIPDYEATAGERRRFLASIDGKQAGDPRKAADAILRVVVAEHPPLHLLLGQDALLNLGRKLGALQEEVLAWAPVSVGTNY
jgi:NAD(P)-dependent dehydrogenase (short-subunit alcohol dehydrogenase family)